MRMRFVRAIDSLGLVCRRQATAPNLLWRSNPASPPGPCHFFRCSFLLLLNKLIHSGRRTWEGTTKRQSSLNTHIKHTFLPTLTNPSDIDDISFHCQRTTASAQGQDCCPRPLVFTPLSFPVLLALSLFPAQTGCVSPLWVTPSLLPYTHPYSTTINESATFETSSSSDQRQDGLVV